MGWKFPWVSSHGTTFNQDFHVSFTADELANGKADYNFGSKPPGEEMPGVSAFWKDDAGEVFHTYSTYGRGVEVMMHTYRLLDLTRQGPRRGRARLHHGMGAPPRPLRVRRRDDEAGHPGRGRAACRWRPRPPSPSWRCSPPFSAAARSPCSARADTSPLTGMIPMYLLMSAFHTAPWLRLLSNRTRTSP